MKNISEMSEYKTLLADPSLKVVDFYADWCNPCQAMMPILNELSSEGDVPFYKVNVDELPDAAALHGIRGIPSLLIIKDGVVKETLAGKQSKEKILACLANY